MRPIYDSEQDGNFHITDAKIRTSTISFNIAPMETYGGTRYDILKPNNVSG